MPRGQPDWRYVAIISDWGIRGDWNAGKIRAAGACADQDGEHVSVRDAADQSDGVLFSWIDRADSAESRDCAAGMADGHRGRIFRWVHHVFEFRVGDGEDAGGGGVAVGYDIRCVERGVWVAAYGRGDSVGESVLGAGHDAPEI